MFINFPSKCRLIALPSLIFFIALFISSCETQNPLCYDSSLSRRVIGDRMQLKPGECNTQFANDQWTLKGFKFVQQKYNVWCAAACVEMLMWYFDCKTNPACTFLKQSDQVEAEYCPRKKTKLNKAYRRLCKMQVIDGEDCIDCSLECARTECKEMKTYLDQAKKNGITLPRGKRVENSNVLWGIVVNEIRDREKPVLLEVVITRSNAPHYIIISGFCESTQSVFINDPLYDAPYWESFSEAQVIYDIVLYYVGFTVSSN